MQRTFLAGAGFVAALAAGGFALGRHAILDDSVFVKGLGPGERESLVYVWTRDADEHDPDFIAVVDADPKSGTYGRILDRAPTSTVGNEAHHFGYTADANRIFAGGLFSNQLFVYDVLADPRAPRLVRTVDLDPTGYRGPHTLYAVPGGMLIAMLGDVDGGGPGGLVRLDNDGNFRDALPGPDHRGSPVYMYDVGIKPEMNRMITSSWAFPQHIQHGPAPAEEVGSAVVVWDWKRSEVIQVANLDKAPLEVRWLHGPDGRGGFINCAYGNSLWYWEDADRDGQLEFHRVVRFPDGSAPADVRISYDNRYLYVTHFGGNRVEQYDIRNPRQPRLVSTLEFPHPNMMKLSPDSRRLYVSNSILSPLDPDEQFTLRLVHVGPEGMRLDEKFRPDFVNLPTGPAGPHDMLLR